MLNENELHIYSMSGVEQSTIPQSNGRQIEYGQFESNHTVV